MNKNKTLPGSVGKNDIGEVPDEDAFENLTPPTPQQEEALWQSYLGTVHDEYLETDEIRLLEYYIESGGELTDDIRPIILEFIRNSKRAGAGRPSNLSQNLTLWINVTDRQRYAEVFGEPDVSDRAALKAELLQQHPDLTDDQFENQLETLQKRHCHGKRVTGRT